MKRTLEEQTECQCVTLCQWDDQYDCYLCELAEEDKCSAETQGACDCKHCFIHIIRNSNLLLSNGWHINYCDNGPGGYGFDVNNGSEIINHIKHYEANGNGPFLDCEENVVVSKELSADEIEAMKKKVVPTAWVPHCSHTDLLIQWRRWFHLLPLAQHGGMKRIKFCEVGSEAEKTLITIRDAHQKDAVIRQRDLYEDVCGVQGCMGDVVTNTAEGSPGTYEGCPKWMRHNIDLCVHHAGDGDIHNIIYYDEDSCTWREYPDVL